jgi:hypothetical protein
VRSCAHRRCASGVSRGRVSIMSSPLSARPARADHPRRAFWQSPLERG